MPVLQGFEEVSLAAPVAKVTMTVTDSAVRFNKATAEVLGFPAYVKVLVNSKMKQIALEPCTGRETNAVKFSKPEGKQKASVSVRVPALIVAILKFFKLAAAPEGEISYQLVPGTVHEDEKVVVFDASDAKAGTMKRRGRKKAAEE